MLIGRFLMIVPILALAGSLARKESHAGERGHIPGSRRHVLRPADRHRSFGRRAEFSAGAHARAGGRALPQPAGGKLF